MKGPVVGIVLLTFFVLNNARWTNRDQDSHSDSIEQALMQPYLPDEYLLLQSRDEFTFTEDQRKFQNDSLVIHNTLRARHCSPPLVLDEEINIRSQIFAEYLARTDSSLVHSTDRGSRFGENLYSVSRKTPIVNISAEKVAMAWYAEIQFYDFNNPAYKASTGHFTQLVWKDTQRIGLGYATGRQGRKMYVVAQYGPPGNYRNRFAQNVLEPKC